MSDLNETNNNYLDNNKTAPASSEKFKRQATKNTNKIIDALNEIGKLSLTEEFSEKDKDKIFKRITKELNSTKKMFDFKKEDDETFSL